jgi:hypothetical protein
MRGLLLGTMTAFAFFQPVTGGRKKLSQGQNVMNEGGRDAEKIDKMVYWKLETLVRHSWSKGVSCCG